MAKFAKILLGCYRTGDANDPEVYTAAAIAVLSDFPLDVIQQVVDPRSGLPSRIRWLPTVSEIRDACQEIYGVRQRAQEWEAGAAKQLAERAKLEAERAARATSDELRAKHGPTFGLDPELAKPLNDEEAERRRSIGDQVSAYTRETILREYRAAGVEPIYAGRTLVSPVLLRQLGKWPPVRKDSAA